MTFSNFVHTALRRRASKRDPPPIPLPSSAMWTIHGNSYDLTPLLH